LQTLTTCAHAAGTDDGAVPAAATAPPGYRLLHPLGRGGQATVYKARRASDGRLVALKIMHSGRAGDADARFRHEISLLSQLDHPGIPAIIDFDRSPGGQTWYAARYVDGRPLHEFIRELDLDAAIGAGAPNGRSSPGSPPRRRSFARAARRRVTLLIEPVVRVVIDVSDAVTAAHRVGVIHRDLKPSNILIDADGRALIVDFGIAKQTVVDQDMGLTLTGQFLGSPAWSSPEQVEARPGWVDVRTDVYALGLVLYHSLTGEFPYDVYGSLPTIFDNIRHAEPRPPR